MGLAWNKQGDSREAIIRWLVETRDRDLQNVPADRQLHIEFTDILHNTAATLKLLADFAGIEPTPQQWAAAMAFPENRYNHHNGQAKAACDCETPCQTCGCGRR
jgi:hypothetical protein